MHLFTQKLLKWWHHHQRPLPWKQTDDAYSIWLSEIILQQTRIDQGLPYYLKFKAMYPTVKDLADSSLDEVMRLWEGLGYYARARNMHQTAKYIANELQGKFPDTYSDIRQLKGIGDYTAAAIASFAFGLPYAVVDGNVYRLLSRCFGIFTPIDSTQGKKQFLALAQQLMSETEPASFNQAIMDFGSVQCKPVKPDCGFCPMQTICVAYRDNTVSQLPVKQKKLTRKTRYFTYFMLQTPKGGRLLRKRTAKDIWENLYEFLLVETDLEPDAGILQSHFRENQISCIYLTEKSLYNSRIWKQQLTHQTIVARFLETSISDPEIWLRQGFVEVEAENIGNYAFPKIINNYLQHRPI